MITFGKKEDNQNYIPRVGAYGIAVKDNLVSVISVRDFHFLVGGGLENNENIEACLKREFLEEIGYEVKIIKHIGSFREYHKTLTTGEYYELLPEVYLVELQSKVCEGIEPDHELVWMSKADAKASLLLTYQKEVVDML